LNLLLQISLSISNQLLCETNEADLNKMFEPLWKKTNQERLSIILVEVYLLLNAYVIK